LPETVLHIPIPSPGKWQLLWVKKREKLSRALLNLAKNKAQINPDIPLLVPTDWSPQMERRLREYGARI